MPMLQRVPSLLRSFTAGTLPVHRRSFHIRSTHLRDVLSKYAPPPRSSVYPMLPQTVADIAPKASGSVKAAFETAATAPVGTSFQDTPPPSSTLSTKLAVQLPAMQPLVPDSIAKPKPPAEREMRVEGVLIPQKPVPPGEEECCMSGCVHCVYTIYADDLEMYTAALSEARQALVKSSRPVSDWPEALRNMEEEGKSAGQVSKEAKAEVASGMDPTMAAFFALEQKLKKQQFPGTGAGT